METLNRTLATAESTDNHPLSESEYTISHFETDSENPTNIPETGTTQNYLPSDSANIISNTDNQPPKCGKPTHPSTPNKSKTSS
ncbi:hypothetical protein [Microcoleus anatoxicus]|uniref:Uncharacterized protein n=1 Tax=Microcoleus anatoxicus PTRS2 TaxID=2705321 RepID=A0ABU8YS43_9CYAN